MEKQFFSFDRKMDLKLRTDKKLDTTIDNTKNIYGLAKYVNLGYYMVTPLLVSVFFGLIIDKYLKTEPKGILIGILFGTISTFYNLLTLVKNN